LSKHIASAVTEPDVNPPSRYCAVAFQPVSVAKRLPDLITAESLVTKLPLWTVSPASHKDIEEKEPSGTVRVVILPTTV
jgi:hypothetical protein